MSAHTPGPWKAVLLPQLTDGSYVATPLGDLVFREECLREEYDAEEEAEVHATMRLIAAAPDLLEALEECANDLESEIANRYPQSVRDYPSMERKFQRDMATVLTARAAIAKARGGQ